MKLYLILLVDSISIFTRSNGQNTGGKNSPTRHYRGVVTSLGLSRGRTTSFHGIRTRFESGVGTREGRTSLSHQGVHRGVVDLQSSQSTRVGGVLARSRCGRCLRGRHPRSPHGERNHGR